MKQWKTKNPDMYFNASRELIELARILRNNATPAEKKLWLELREMRSVGVRFRRQHPVWRYIADFYCVDLKLLIEVDGPIHDDKSSQDKDANRTAELERMGITVIRFTNDEVQKDLSVVLEKVHLAISKTPPPLQGEGVGG